MLSKNQLNHLFLGCIFPINFWTLFVFFGHFEWLSQKDGGIALSVLSYFLTIALFESILLFIFLFLFNFILPSSWSPKNKYSLLVLTAWNISFAFMFAQFLDSFLQEQKFVWIWISLAILGLTIISARLLTYHEKFAASIDNLINRISVLAFMFLTIDIIGVITVIFRNI